MITRGDFIQKEMASAKAGHEKTLSADFTSPTSNSRAEQRSRLLAALRLGPVTTLEARQDLDIMHPAGRVMELRRAGYPIDTVWTRASTSTGKAHRVSKYVLLAQEAL